MIQIKAPDGSIAQFPDGTPDDTIKGVMAKNYPPSLTDIANQTQPAAAAQPAATAARADRDLASIVGAESPPAAPSRGVMGIVDQSVRGLAQGAVKLATLPADAAALVESLQGAGLRKIGVPDMAVNMIQNANPVVRGLSAVQPYVGSDALLGYLDAANRKTADVLGVERPVEKPQNLGERVANRVSEEVGSFALPVAGAIKTGAKIGVDAARELPGIARMFVEPAAINPTKFAAKEGSMAVAAGSGAAAAGEITHASGVDKHSVTGQVADFTGALLGALGLGAARTIGKPIKDVAQAVFARDKFSNDTVKNNVVDRLANTAESLPKVEGQPIDTQPLVDAIAGGRRVDATIPGFRESLADRTADPGIAALEYGRQTGPNAGQFVQRRSENTGAIDTAMNKNAPDGNPAALRAELDFERGRRLTDANVETRNAQDAFDRSTQALQPVMTGEGRGANIRTALENASAGARNIVREAWAPIERSGEHVDMAPLAEDFGGINRNLSTAERERFRPGEATIPQRLSGEREIAPAVRDAQGTVTTPAQTETITQPISEVTGLRSALTDAAREARDAGRVNEARIIDDHVTALDNYLDHAVPEPLRQQYDAARASTRDFNDRFTRPQSAIAQTLDRTQGQYSQPDSAVAGKFVQADEGRINEFRNLMRETGNDDRTVTAVRDQILADVRDRNLLERPDQLTDYLGRYRTVLSDPRFAGVRDGLDNAAGLRRSLEGAQTNETTLTRDLGTPDQPGTSTVGKYLQYGDERAQDALKGVIASKNPGQAADELLRFVNDAPEAVNGGRKAFWDLMQSKARSNGETTRTVDGTQPWMPNRLKNFLDDPAHVAVTERLYRDEPEQLSNIRKIADELQNVDVRSRGKAPNTSGTSQGLSNVLTPETLQSRFYAYKRGQTSLGFMLTALGSVAARRLVRGAQGEAMERLLDRALLDPDLAAQLLKENNPANRAALARTSKAFLGNEASTLTDILNGGHPDDQQDDTKSAIMRAK